jgi:cysteine desulfurase
VNVRDGLREGPIYLDYNATTPVEPQVIDACVPFLADYFGNPSSSHDYGRRANDAVADARRSVADLLGCAPDEIVFTGGGSNSDTLAVRGAALARRDRGDHIITQVTEHPAVLATCDAMRRLHGFRITELPVDQHGLVDPAELEAAITERTALVSIMHANNETGTVQPIRELAEITHTRGALFHTDASQSTGKIDVSLQELDVDLLTVTGHKMYAPKGIGALYVRKGLNLEPAVYGGGQEHGMHGGTENVALIVALGRAVQLTQDADTQRIQRLRDLLFDQLDQNLPGRIHLNGHPTLRLPNTLNISIAGATGDTVLSAAPGVAAATGSACHEGDPQPSPVLIAMGLPVERALSALRLSLGRWTTSEDVMRAAEQLTAAVSALTPA